MFKKRKIKGRFIFISLIYLTALSVLDISFANTLNQKILILYEERNFFADKRDSIAAIQDLLGHYKVSTVTEKLSKTKNYDFKNYDIVFVVALDRNIDYPNLNEGLNNYENKIIWLGNGIQNFLSTNNYPLIYEEEGFNLNSVSYRKQGTGDLKKFSLGEKRGFYKIRSLSDNNKIKATLSDGFYEYPFIIESKNLTYISRVDINEPLFYIFADYLSTFLYKKYYSEDKILISIEDVHIFSDYQNLKDLTDILYSHNIEFTIGFIPYVRQETSRHITSFTESKQFIETLKYMQEKGGSIVLHTYVHNITEDEIRISRENTKALESIEGYFNKAVKDCVENGLFPIGYSASHAYLEKEERDLTKKIFSSSYGQVFINEGNYIVYPFELYDTKNFNQFFPINLGYVQSSEENKFGMIDLWLDKISVVEGYFGGIYFHSSTDKIYLEELINKLISRKTEFAKPLDKNHFVNTNHYNLEFKQNQKNITKNMVESKNKLERVYGNLFFAITIILTITVLLFGVILRKNLKKRKETMFKG